jgi:hypothetical protein
MQTLLVPLHCLSRQIGKVKFQGMNHATSYTSVLRDVEDTQMASASSYIVARDHRSLIIFPKTLQVGLRYLSDAEEYVNVIGQCMINFRNHTYWNYQESREEIRGQV